MPQDKRTYQIVMTLTDPQPRTVVDVEAHTPGLAIRYAESQNPGYAVESIDGRRLIGRCHSCSIFILEGDRFHRRTGSKLLCHDCG